MIVKKKHIVLSLAVYGCIATGVLYLAVGVIAILSFLRLKDGGADESSLLVFLNDFLAGRILIWIILLGTLSYVFWRFFEAITDPYQYGSELKGLMKRISIALSTIADALIVYSATVALLGNAEIRADGKPEAQRQLVSDILQESWGQGAIMLVGVIVLLVAAVQFFYGVTRGYKERLEIGHFSAAGKRMVHILGWIGYFSRGVIIGIIGFFYLKAGYMENGQDIVNTDKAFDFVGDHVGHLFFILLAIGTMCYGFFMFTLGATYNAEEG